ncbi:MAG: hypothetical protein ACTSO5_02270 [Candidatus Heimdallarchaeaceae archaeon]
MDGLKPRFSHFKKKIQMNKRELFIRICLILVLFALSAVIQHFVSSWFLRINGGALEYFHESGVYWEAVSDAKQYYEPYLLAFREGNWDIYQPGQELPLKVYYYGPYFAYFLAFISLFVDLFTNASEAVIVEQTVRIAPFLFDAFSTVMIFLIIDGKLSKSKKSRKRTCIAICVALCYNFMPIVLLYNGVLGLNSYMFTSFTLLSLYFFEKKKPMAAGSILTLSFLTKQMSLFFLPIWFLILVRNDIEESIKFLMAFFLSFILLSLPWIFKHPTYYIGVLLGQGYSGITHFSISQEYILFSTTPFHTLLLIGANKLAYVYYILNKIYIPFIIFSLIFYRIGLIKGDHLIDNRSSFFTFNAIYIIGIHLFISRGVYKNYYTFLIPFILIALAEWITNIKRNWMSIVLLISMLFWLIGVNILIIWLSKYIHTILLVLFWIPLFITYNKEMHLALFLKENYEKTTNYFKRILHIIK